MKQMLREQVALFLIIALCWKGHCEISIHIAEYGKSLQKLQYTTANEQTRYIELAAGKTYQIKCDLNGITLDNDPWISNTTEIDYLNTEEAMQLTEDSRVFYNTVNTNAYLHLYKLNSTFAGRYRCIANAENYKDVVISIGNPSITLCSSMFTKIEGTSKPFSFAVILNGNPKPSINDIIWYFNDELIDLKQLKMEILEFFIAQVAHVAFTVPNGYHREQTGVYTAVVNTTAGITNSSFRLEVLTHPLITFESNCDCLKDRKIAVKYGQNFTLSCKVDYASPPPTFTWFKDGKNDSNNVPVVAAGTRLTVQHVPPAESQLTFTEIMLEDAGVYYCKANNTLMKDIQSVNVQVEYLPNVTAISPQLINVPIGKKLQLLVRLKGSYYPTPTINWIHSDNKLTNQTTLITANDRIAFNGVLGINLTIENVNVNDSGAYFLKVANNVEEILLHFNISILVPPILSRLSNNTIRAGAGGNGTFSAVIYNAQPPVTLSNISWNGNFDVCQQEVSYKNGIVTLVLSDLQVSNTGLITLTIYHSAGIVNQTYKLIVLNVPAIPNPVSIVQCSGFIKISWETVESSPTTAPVDKVILEERACSYNDLHCSDDWSILTVSTQSGSQSLILPFAPNQYSFRLTSCSNVIGCGQSLVIGTEVKSSLQDFIPMIAEVATQTLDSSSFQIEWDQLFSSECHKLMWYNITCWNTNETANYVTKNTTAKGYGHYTITMSPLGPDSEYNCSIQPFYYHLLSSSIISGSGDQQVYTIGYTFPITPEHNGFDIVVTNTYNRLVNRGTLLLNSFDFVKKVRQTNSVGLVRVIVVRLGNSSTLPSGIPNDSYDESSYNLSSYHSVHSNPTNDDYRPYIAAEFDFNLFPEYFIIGGGGNNSTNGPLDISNYYTVFIRLYPWSKFNERRTVYISSSFSTPLRPFSRASTSLRSATNDTTNTTQAVTTSMAVILIIVCIFFAVVVLILAKNKCASRCKAIKTNSLPIMNTDYV